MNFLNFDEKGQFQIIVFLIILIPVIALVYIFIQSALPPVTDLVLNHIDNDGSNTPDSGIHRLIFLFYPFAVFIVALIGFIVLFRSSGG